jgi:hypothetical protein
LWNRVVQNDGTANYTGNSTVYVGAGTFNNNGNFTVNTASSIGFFGQSSASAFNNAGTFTKLGAVAFARESGAGSGTTVRFNNSGTVDVQGGTLSLDMGGTQSGPFAIAGGATLSLSGTHAFSVGADITGAGNLSVTGGTVTDARAVNISGAISLAGGTATFDGGVSGGASLILSAGTAHFNQAATFASGTITSSSSTLGVLPS